MRAAPAAARVSDTYRWTQLAIGVGAMVMIANYQYGWTFFVPDIQKKFGWDRASIQWAFTLFVLFETWLVPIEGWFVDKYGPRLVVLIGGILCAIGWAINAEATTLNGYYLGMIVARHRRRRRLRHLRRQRAEMVSGQARPCRRHHRGGIRRRLGADGRADPGHDQGFRLPEHLPLFRPRPGHHRRASSPSSCSRRSRDRCPPWSRTPT